MTEIVFSRQQYGSAHCTPTGRDRFPIHLQPCLRVPASRQLRSLPSRRDLSAYRCEARLPDEAPPTRSQTDSGPHESRIRSRGTTGRTSSGTPTDKVRRRCSNCRHGARDTIPTKAPSGRSRCHQGNRHTSPGTTPTRSRACHTSPMDSACLLPTGWVSSPELDPIPRVVT